MEWNQRPIEDKEEIISNLVEEAYNAMAAVFPDDGLSDQDMAFFIYQLTFAMTRSTDHTYSLINNLANRLHEMKSEGKLVGG